MKISKKASRISPSLTLSLSAKAKELKLEGQDIISLGVGEPDFNTPDNIIDAAKKAMDDGFTKYTAPAGIPELRKAIVKKLKRDNSIDYEESQITIGCGAKQLLYNLFQALLDPNDEVLVPSPYWVSYLEQVKLADGIPVVVEGKEENCFKVTVHQLKEKVTEKTKALFLNTPSNPTGMVYNEDELRAIGQFCIEKDICIVSDEIYEHIIYGKEQHISIASLGEKYKNQTILINGVSKAYSMTGWRIGYAAGPKDLIKAMTDITSHSTSSATSIAQYAAVEALEGPQGAVEEMKREFKLRRDYVVEKLKEIPGMKCETPPGAFYAFVSIKDIIKNSNGKYTSSDDWTSSLLEKQKVMVIPGTAFGAPNHIRISYATSLEQLQEAIYRIYKFICDDK